MPFDEAQGKPEDKRSTRSEREERILQFWKENKIFHKALENPPAGGSKGDFVFYEGPPTANGKPGIHHLESRAFKDAIPRYRTMRGYRVKRQAGWDTHGLPVELEVEKQLGLKSKKEIEAYGVEKFNAECRKNVWKYIDEWVRFTDRSGYWVDLENPYITYKNSYIEKVWQVVAKADERKLLYKDYRVVPWCPRCGTALSSHELAQGYQDVKDLSLYAKFKIVGFPDAYFLAWTTTPWTLPGNLALAVGPDIIYVEAKVGKDIYVLAKDRLSIIKEPYEIVAEHKGSEMVGMQYEPLYSFIKDDSPAGEGKAFKIYPADFVTTEDGTGIVHTAVMYGQEDFELGTKIGLPKVHLVNPDASFKSELGWLSGRSVIDPELSVDILKDLKERGLLFDKENYAHSYPFCWRCKTRLIYYARDSWYIRMSALRDELVKENEKIHWEPNHIKEGRFGEWLKEVKDWAISRERYWGTPLPVWLTEDGKTLVVNSLEKLREYTKKSGNKYFLMRHGEARHNAMHVLDPKGDPENHLTPKGKEEVQKAAHNLKSKNIGLIFASPFIRTRETAEILQKELSLPVEALKIDERIREFDESDSDNVRKRMGELIFELEAKNKDKNILIISHGSPLWHLGELAAWRDGNGFSEYKMLNTAQVQEIDFAPFPHDEGYNLDLHKPFIDDVVLVKDGQEYRRAKEVMDVWLDSGAMPFASDVSGFPADYVSEAIDQTRGWFYTLHAVGVIMGKGHAFNNAICMGHVLDAEGKKMSKSQGNTLDPFVAIERFGADTLRLWMYAVNQPGESKNFDERTVKEMEKTLNLLDNVLAFYELYRDDSVTRERVQGKNVLDKWILGRLNELTGLTTKNMDEYRLLEPVRAIRDFVDDLSTWYLRRSRDRIKNGDKEAKATLYYVLKETVKLLAPFAPFAADEIYQKLKLFSEPESVHLANWPEVRKSLLDFGSTEKLLNHMNLVRKIVSEVLMIRNKENIKIRQPLGLLKIQDSLLEGKEELINLIKDEVNVKQIEFDKQLSTGFHLDTTLTPELIEEGKIREEIRSLQDLRKERGLKPGDKMEFTPPAEKLEFYRKHGEEIGNATSSTISGV